MTDSWVLPYQALTNYPGTEEKQILAREHDFELFYWTRWLPPNFGAWASCKGSLPRGTNSRGNHSHEHGPLDPELLRKLSPDHAPPRDHFHITPLRVPLFYLRRAG